MELFVAVERTKAQRGERIPSSSPWTGLPPQV